jgi:transcriptional regulator with PAS, ATPase and Fis domain
MSRRRTGPFVAINCAALVETLIEAELFGIEDRIATGVRARRGKFEAADGGTLFLDEVSDLSPSAQAKLLRAIQDMAVERVGSTTGVQRLDIRIIAATNRPLCALVEQRAFRPDLFYRLSGVDIRVPSLRERGDDILELADHFLSRHRASRALTLSPEAADALVTYHWPGNVRELERLIERTIALGRSERIELEDLSPVVAGRHLTAIAPSLKHDDTLRTWARKYVALMLARNNGNRRQAARALGISYHTLRAHIRPPAGSDADPVAHDAGVDAEAIDMQTTDLESAEVLVDATGAA